MRELEMDVKNRLCTVGVLAEVADDVLADGDRVGKILRLAGAENAVGAEWRVAKLPIKINVGVQSAASVAGVSDG